ncbi:hypothetical protein [Geodermatophilus sp. SYSU D00710]
MRDRAAAVRALRARADRLRDAADLVGSWADAADVLADVVEEGVD